MVVVMMADPPLTVRSAKQQMSEGNHDPSISSNSTKNHTLNATKAINASHTSSTTPQNNLSQQRMPSEHSNPPSSSTLLKMTNGTLNATGSITTASKTTGASSSLSSSLTPPPTQTAQQQQPPLQPPPPPQDDDPLVVPMDGWDSIVDDLLSLGSGGSPMSSSRPALNPATAALATTNGGGAPSTLDTAAPMELDEDTSHWTSSPRKHQLDGRGRMDDASWRIHPPGVHMHLQDNAKLPTFNLPVNRSAVRRTVRADGGTPTTTLQSQEGNLTFAASDTGTRNNRTAGSASQSLIGGPKPPPRFATSSSLTTKLHPPQFPSNFLFSSSSSSSLSPSGTTRTTNPTTDSSKLAELFLSRSDRHVPYAHSQTTTTTTSTLDTAVNMKDALDTLLETDLQGVDPTPLSEIRQRHETYQALQQLQPPESASSTTTTTTPAPLTGPMDTSSTNHAITTTTTASHPSTTTTTTTTRRHRSSSFHKEPYSVRPIPLPIPTKKISPPGSPQARSMNGPTATALSLGPPTRTTSSSTTTTTTTIPSGATSIRSFSTAPPVTTSSNSTTGSKRPLSSSTNNNNNKSHSSTYSSSTSLPTASSFSSSSFQPTPAIFRASEQKSKYGFGRTHVVPSIPPPLLATTTTTTGTVRKPFRPQPTSNGIHRTTASGQPALASSNGLASSTAAATSSSGSHTAAAGVPTNNNNKVGEKSGGNHQFAAYERKKQRAKDARVKLNESIERLSVAISLAGTQSKERADHWMALPSMGSTVCRQAGLDICRECVETCDSAKKWDRPSFVGSAASLIHALNAQCESLMRELATVHQQHESDLGRAVEQATAATSEPRTQSPHQPLSDEPQQQGGRDSMEVVMEASVVNPPESTHHPETNNQNDPNLLETAAFKEQTTDNHPVAFDVALRSSPHHTKRREESSPVTTSMDHLASSFKRQKLNEGTEADPQHVMPIHTIEIVPNDSNQDSTSETAVFSNHRIMTLVASFLDPTSLVRCQRLCKGLNSMGVFTSDMVWQGLATARFGFFNVRQWHAKLDDEDEGITTPSLSLYRSMDRANVMPPFIHDGMFLLGEAQMPHKVSAWVFLVERSNGETLRSTRRRPDLPGKGDYTSLPILELRTVIQNIGCSSSSTHHHTYNDDRISIRNQKITVDASTRRRGEEMKEVDWDDRFQKRLERLDGTPFVPRRHHQHTTPPNRTPDLAHLGLFESVVIVSFIYARGCSTNSKFVQRSNFSKVLIGLSTGVTMPLVIPFPRDASHLQH